MGGAAPGQRTATEFLAPTGAQLADVVRLQFALSDVNENPRANRGEAETIYFAMMHTGGVATDDADAYDLALAQPELGFSRVMDSIDILRESVAAGDISAMDAHSIANAIEQSGRFLRQEHKHYRGPSYFSVPYP